MGLSRIFENAPWAKRSCVTDEDVELDMAPVGQIRIRGRPPNRRESTRVIGMMDTVG
jgi:hypothetical protein